LIAGRRRSTIDVPVVFPSAFGSHPSLTEPRISGVRRLRPSDVPAITTEFLPHIQHRLQGYRPNTPSSSSSLHGRQHEKHGDPYARGPDTALSTTSLHSQAFTPSRSHGPLETPLSVAAPHPTDVFVPSMRREEHHAHDSDAQTHSAFVPSMPSHDFAHSREAFLDRAAYWHETTSASPESTFPMFYQHVTNSRHVTNTHGHSHHGYPGGGDARDVPGSASGQGFLSHRGTVAPTRGHDAAGAPSEDVDQETMAVWSATPIGFELEDWGSYLDTVNQITQARMQ